MNPFVLWWMLGCVGVAVDVYRSRRHFLEDIAGLPPPLVLFALVVMTGFGPLTLAFALARKQPICDCPLCSGGPR